MNLPNLGNQVLSQPADYPDVDDLTALAADPELAAMFVAETLDHLGAIEATLLQLETSLLQADTASRDAALLDDLFRPFHTIKGNAATLGVLSIQDVAHSVEDLLDAVRAGTLQVGLADVELLLRSVDLLSTMVTDLGRRLSGHSPANLDDVQAQLTNALDRRVSGKNSAGPGFDPGDGDAIGPSVVEAAATQSIKVDTRKLDAVVDMVSELAIAQSLLQQNTTLQKVQDDALAWQIAQMRRITRDLQHTVMALRLVPIRQTFQKMARLIRDLSRSSGKPVELTLAGEDTELDRRMVEELADPLMHMLRNSMDHGIEDPETRVRSGKPVPARLSLSAHQEGAHIVIAIADDGAGLDADRILAKARAMGVVRPDETLPPSEIYQLIFRPGFSTAERVTAISGRGVGMDVARCNVEALRGWIEVETTRGEGTTFLIKLPVTAAMGALVAAPPRPGAEAA